MQIGEFSFIIAALGSKLGVTDPAIYPIIVAASVLTTFLTPYIMKTTIPCYNFLYNRLSPAKREKIDRREQEVEAAEQAAQTATVSDGPSTADKVRHSVRKTFVTKHVVELFIKNMSENDKPAEKKDEPQKE